MTDPSLPIDQDRLQSELTIAKDFQNVWFQRTKEVELATDQLGYFQRISPFGKTHLWDVLTKEMILYGVGASLATFGALRFGLRMANRSGAAQKSHSPFRPLDPQQQQQADQGGTSVFSVLELLVDSWLSVSMGRMVALSMVTDEHLTARLPAVPMKAGNSLLCDEFCTVMVEEYKRQWKLAAPGISHRQDSLIHPNLDGLDRYTQFAKNCQKRQAMEQRIRREQGLGPEDPVAIPWPGVVDDGISSGTGLSFSTQDGSAWSAEELSSFVEDREDSDRKW